MGNIQEAILKLMMKAWLPKNRWATILFLSGVCLMALGLLIELLLN